MKGVTTTSLNFWGNTPSAKDRLTSFVIDRSKISTQSFKRKVGTGSKRHAFVGDFLMILSTSFYKISLKWDRLGCVHMGSITVVEEAVNMSQILLIFVTFFEAPWKVRWYDTEIVCNFTTCHFFQCMFLLNDIHTDLYFADPKDNMLYKPRWYVARLDNLFLNEGILYCPI